VAEAIGVGWADPAEIDKTGIAAATRQAMGRALSSLNGQVGALLIDYVRLPEIDLHQRALPKADARCLSVAAASIVAKVARDRLMMELDRDHPGYGFARHKGYGAQLGPSPAHRMSWRPLQTFSEAGK
jgi:ribonuclease HII